MLGDEVLGLRGDGGEVGAQRLRQVRGGERVTPTDAAGDPFRKIPVEGIDDRGALGVGGVGTHDCFSPRYFGRITRT